MDMSENIRKKIAKGTFWSAIDIISGQGVTFVVGLVLARLLTPSDYGLIGICLIINTVLSAFVDGGFSNSLIRKKEVSDLDYNTMFLSNIGLSIGLYILLYLATPFIASFFNNDVLEKLIHITSLILIIDALSIVQNTIITKRLDFKLRAKASFTASIISGCIGIVLALKGYGVWALAVQIVSRSLLNTILLVIVNRWLPCFTFSRDSFRYMWSFGWKLVATTMLNQIFNEIYQTVVAKCYTPATLGQYTRAREYAKIFSSNISNIIQRVSFPMLSNIQDDKERLLSVYRKSIKMTSFVTFVCLFSLSSVSDSLIYVLIGPQWHQAAQFLPLICLSLSLQPLSAINLNIMKVYGRSDVVLKLEIIKKSMAILPIALGIFVGIYWMLVGSVITGISAFVINTYYIGKQMEYTSLQQIKDIIPSIRIALLIAIPAYIITILDASELLTLLLQVICIVALFFSLCIFTKNEEYKELMKMVNTLIKK